VQTSAKAFKHPWIWKCLLIYDIFLTYNRLRIEIYLPTSVITLLPYSK